MSVRAKLWTREEYDRLIAVGALRPEARVQLIQGEIVEMTPQSAAHATALRRVQKVLDAVFSAGYDVRAQLPLALGELSEPEPDIAVVPGSLEDYRAHHPTTAALVVEVADTTLQFDRTRKQEIYAAARIPEYWIVDLVDAVLEVYRDPQGASYRTAMRLTPGQQITPLAAPQASVDIDALFP
ncbi:MAG: Uma2 family endonuclease [Armatimonadota bacterium]|nr:Uma2 family endonuclease [Armatimonadota bacterium]MDR7451473.1 Uma2 family endonuclease [Armatimonadota bacterium]MDR7467440.1 Uma2 family endonuclease [Armatimonadota bacterium]MDR7494314.1 Uma2 family endonuclease [Armatimonadota bacterium]MDR7504858.1 Uma2 family endonuclease [Armatimonadota bacterium]